MYSPKTFNSRDYPALWCQRQQRKIHFKFLRAHKKDIYYKNANISLCGTHKKLFWSRCLCIATIGRDSPYKTENSVIIYSPLYRSKLVLLTFLCEIQKNIQWKSMGSNVVLNSEIFLYVYKNSLNIILYYAEESLTGLKKCEGELMNFHFWVYDPFKRERHLEWWHTARMVPDTAFRHLRHSADSPEGWR